MANLNVTRNNSTQEVLDVDYSSLFFGPTILAYNLTTQEAAYVTAQSALLGARSATAFDVAATYEAGDMYCLAGTLIGVTNTGTQTFNADDLLNTTIYDDLSMYFVGVSYA